MEHLIIIHGAIGAEDQMIPLGELLSDSFEIRYLELYGHGGKSDDTAPFEMHHFVEQLNEMVNGADRPVHVFGYSMGGFIALLAASQGNDNIASIFTLGTKLKWDPEIAEKEAGRLNPDKIEEKVPALAEALQKRHGSEHWRRVLEETTKVLLKLGEEQPINSESMSRVSCPVHLSLGDQDVMVSPEETEMIAGYLTRGFFSILEDSKHPIEQADVSKLAQKIKEFVVTCS